MSSNMPPNKPPRPKEVTPMTDNTLNIILKLAALVYFILGSFYFADAL